MTLGSKERRKSCTFWWDRRLSCKPQCKVFCSDPSGAGCARGAACSEAAVRRQLPRRAAGGAAGGPAGRVRRRDNVRPGVPPPGRTSANTGDPHTCCFSRGRPAGARAQQPETLMLCTSPAPDNTKHGKPGLCVGLSGGILRPTVWAFGPPSPGSVADCRADAAGPELRRCGPGPPWSQKQRIVSRSHGEGLYVFPPFDCGSHFFDFTRSGLFPFSV